MPESATGPGLVTVKVSVLVAPGAMVAGANAFAMVGLPSTLSVAVLETGPRGSVEVMTPLEVLFCAPTVLPITTTVSVQPAAGTFRPEKPRAVCPAVSAAAGVQVPPVVWFDATAMFTSVSVKAPPVCATPVGLVSVKVSVVLPPATMGLGENDLAMLTRPTPRFAVFDTGPVVPVSTVVTPEVVFA